MNEDKSKSDVVSKPSSAITSSSESETFETWTLVTPELTDKKNKSNVHETKVLDFGDDRQHIEILKRDDTHTDGEMSDGISVISDSESGGRASPQPSPRRLSLPNRDSTTPKNNISENEEDNLNIKDEMNYRPITPSSTPEAIDLSSQSIHEDSLLQQQTAAADQRINETNAAEDDDDNQAFTMQLRWNSITSISKAFYLAALVAAIAIFGCMRAPPQQPAAQTGDLNAIYAKLNDILTTTGRLEELVHATLSEINDHGAISPYIDVLTNVREMNTKFDANNRALRDVLNRIEQLPEKYETLLTVVESDDIEKPLRFEDNEEFKENYQEKLQQVKNDQHKKRQYEKSTKSEEKPKKKFDDAEKDNRPKRQDRERPKSGFDENEKRNEYNNKEKDYKRNDFENDDESYQPHHKSNYNAKLRGNDAYNDREKQRKNAYNEHPKSASSHEEQEKSHKPHDKPYKSDYKERESHHKNENGAKDDYRKNDYKTTKDERIKKNDNKKFDESEEDWMERRSRYREDSRKDSDRRKTNDESANWYLERGSGRQKARKPVEA